MLFVYGPYLPVRILEEIRFWKEQEAEHTDVIKAIIPTLEPNFVKLLDEWKQVFSSTQEAADRLLQHGVTSEDAACDPQLIKETERILEASFRQSKEFIRQLYFILDQSAAAKSIPLAKTVLLHIIRESEYFLGVLETLNHPGKLADLMKGAVPVIDPYRPDAGSQVSSFSTQAETLLVSGQQPAYFTISGAQKQLQYDRSEIENSAEPAGSEQDRINNRPVPIGGHTLPPLPYPYNALEPYIDEKTMRIHHDKHHKTYVDDLNKAEKKLQEARKSGNFELVKHWERELAFNGAGHYLHTIFWDIMNPKGGGKPEGELLEQIKRDFGSYEAFHKQFSSAAEKVEGGGWAILVWSPRSHRLEILTAEKHQNLSQWDVVPLLPLDVWEHAYYLKHQNNRKDYIADWWNVVYWPAVAERYEKAKKLKWQPF
ncbi:Fe-Mn family superoxide dismutase [Fontibacillus phaseoli]|uniref:superoxide dismutase n=1 Tax=Fontibacillus phaseoli TaxID=1416533 RepID=A0A369B4I6_9BACL|nr:Fe-Mn family superoxide dismutase [Fontibacillus phaseoli]RCX16215.1 Fe-Mn family superoxide dismutase [Fontibacillus phaseoli]